MAAGTAIYTSEKLTAIYNDKIETENTKTKAKKTFECELTVLALGSRPDSGIVKELKEAGIEPLVIGDCNKVGKIADATKTAYLAAVSI